MQLDLHELAKRIATNFEKLPAPVYNGMRLIYRTAKALRNPQSISDFNDAHYVQSDPHINYQSRSPIDYFKKLCLKILRKPNPDFDIIWYVQNYGHTFDLSQTDPYSHYIEHGKSQGNAPRPPRKVRFNKTASRPLPHRAKRACLFAGYDPDGYIDEYVLIYLKELARHADVFYLADCDMHETELSKLDGLVKGAWAKRHGTYDFGSYSMLARDFVGWEALSEYDEVVFANDSGYLVRSLDDIFARMNDQPIAWWGLQASKGLKSTLRLQPFPVDDDHINMSDVKDTFLDQFEADQVYDFHIGSYFIAFRKDVICDERFQRVINAVQPEEHKLSIVLKYEVGLTHFLIGHGYEFATFGQNLTKSHPVYTAVAFDLLEDGFPLFKRFFITENHYKQSSISYWKAALNQAGSVTSIAVIEDNYLRVSDADKIYRNFHVLDDGVLPDRRMSNHTFKSYDATSPKYDHYWGFPVCAFDHNLSDNTRAVFEAVKDDPNIRKVIFTRKRVIRPGGKNVVVVPLVSKEGQEYLARCRHLFVKHGATRNLHWAVNPELHNIINLWHGIPLKRIGTASLDLADHREKMIAQNQRLCSVISASDIDRLAMNSAFTPLPLENIWLTGLPRHDFVTKPEAELPDFLCHQLKDLRQLTAGRRMILFCPTFRNDQENGYYSFTQEQVDQLTLWLTKHDMVMGIREHLNDKSLQYSTQLSGETFVRVQSGRFPDIEMPYREAAMLITDYSSCFIDFMLTERPMISFAYDLEAYKLRERGLFYELEDVFPGPVSKTFDDLMAALDLTVEMIGKPPNAAYESKRKLFIKYKDSGNTARVVEKTKDLNSGSTFAKVFQGLISDKQEKSVVFLQPASLDVVRQNRISSLMANMTSNGWTCEIGNTDSMQPDVIARAEYVLFCGLELSMQTLDVAEFIQANGGKIIYDTDCLIHDETALVHSETFTQTPRNANRLRLSGSLSAQMMAFADGFTVTTPALLRSVAPFGKPAAIVTHSLPQDLLTEDADLRSDSPHKQVHISYLSGTAADFKECGAALHKVLTQRPEVVLHVVGPLNIDHWAQDIADTQIHRHDLIPYAETHEFLRMIDLNLAPLAQTAFNDAKSAVEISEAALHGVPTIASPSEPYRTTIDDRKTGYLARTQQEWYDALCEAVDDATNRQKIGAAAKRKIVPTFTSDVAAKQLTEFLTKHVSNVSA
ncbi:MAG: CDP-glycerol glycerophosphotransferase family protein [Litoreibacter sp.]